MTDIPERLPTASGDRSTEALSPLLYLVLGCQLTFAGHLDAHLLRCATRLALDAEPVLGCRFRPGLLSAEWERCRGLDALVPFSIADTTDAYRDAVAFHGEPLEESGPRIAVRLLRSSDHDDVCIKLDHRAGDGWSTKELAYLLAETYCMFAADPEYRPAPDLSPRPGHRDLWEALTPEQHAAAKNAPGMALPRWRKRVRPGRGAGLAVRRLTLEPSRLDALRIYGRARDATVNDVLVTALLRSLVDEFPDAKNGLLGASISADLRPFVTDPRFERICTLASPMTIGVPYRTNESFEETLATVASTTKAYKEGLWGGSLYGGLELPWRVSKGIWQAYVAATGRSGTVPPVVMNIGVLDDERLRFGDATPVAAHVLGSFGRVPSFGFTISTYRDTLTVWLGAREEDVDPAINERVLRGIDDELATALSAEAGLSA